MRGALLPLLAVPPGILSAYSSGPDYGYAGAPGEPTCSSCHGDSSGSGNVTVTFPDALTYTPGAAQHLLVTISDAAQKRWGFELTARPADSATMSGGVFTPGSDGFTQLVCTSSSYQFGQFGSACSGSSRYPQQYIEQTSSGSRPGQAGSAQFAFDWTPPANATGNMVIYVAANAANNNGSDTGDHIYMSTYTLTPAATNLPIVSANGVVNAAGFQASISSGSWVAIEGSNLSATTRLWAASDFVNGALPIQLDNVKVTIDNKPAFVEYISPALVNVLAPADASTGPVAVQVTNPNGTSQTVMANLQTVSPAFFLWNGTYAAATRPDYSLVVPPNLFQGAVTMPARPADVIVLWGTGFGPTSPVVPAGQNTPSDQLYNTAGKVTVLIGNIQANVLAAVLTPGNAGLYQIAVQIPPNVPASDLAIVAQINGVQSPSSVFLTVTP
jgi:uncharacterized protein (TIGR03437 family)